MACLVAFVLSLFLFIVATRYLRNLANAKGWITTPQTDRHMHTIPAPRLVSGSRVEELNSFGLDPWSYCLVVCRFEPENHVKELIEGFLESDSHTRLVLVGDATAKARTWNP